MATLLKRMFWAILTLVAIFFFDCIRALESKMLLRIKQQGLDIVPRILIVKRLLPDAVGATCNQRLEKVYGTEHSHILRVPFRTKKGILRKWISRIEVWPYLETFTECTIAHALEKTKYPNSDIYWKNFEEKYHFSCQFTAYLYAMNHTDFIILVHSRRLLEARTLLDSVRSLLISSLFVPPCWHHIHTVHVHLCLFCTISLGVYLGFRM